MIWMIISALGFVATTGFLVGFILQGWLWIRFITHHSNASTTFTLGGVPYAVVKRSQ